MHAQRYRKPIGTFEPAALTLLHEHAWPGNVRELDHAVERAVLMAQGATIQAADLGLRRTGPVEDRLDEMSLEDIEALFIRKAMSRYGNVSHAAKALGLSRSALYRRLERHRCHVVKAVCRWSATTAACWRWRWPAARRPSSWRRSICARCRGRCRHAWRPGWRSWRSGPAWRCCARRHVARPLQTISNLLAALREGDFSIRARTGGGADPLEHVMFEINTLADTLRGQRLGAQEATALLHAVMAEIDVAIFAFDGHQRLVLVNRYGARLLGVADTDLIGRSAETLGLQGALQTAATLQDLTFAGGAGRWEVRRTRFFQGGSPHDLLALSDLSQPLREQEREAWRRLIRVIGHELNNSLAPIKSIAGSLESLLGRDPLPGDWRDDMTHGLSIIAARSDALGRFTSAYARLARLPPPTRVQHRPRAARCGASPRSIRGAAVALAEGPPLSVEADADQLEQLLINVTRNAVDAALETGGARRARLDAAGRLGGDSRGRRGAGVAEHREPLRALLHHQAGRIGHRPRPQPADRRGPRGHARPSRTARTSAAPAPPCASRGARAGATIRTTPPPRRRSPPSGPGAPTTSKHQACS